MLTRFSVLGSAVALLFAVACSDDEGSDGGGLVAGAAGQAGATASDGGGGDAGSDNEAVGGADQSNGGKDEGARAGAAGAESDGTAGAGNAGTANAGGGAGGQDGMAGDAGATTAGAGGVSSAGASGAAAAGASGELGTAGAAGDPASGAGAGGESNAGGAAGSTSGDAGGQATAGAAGEGAAGSPEAGAGGTGNEEENVFIIEAVEDATITEDGGEELLGALELLVADRLDEDHGGGASSILIRPAEGALDVLPEDAAIVSAQLVLHVADNGDELRVRAVTGEWSQDSVTYDTAPDVHNQVIETIVTPNLGEAVSINLVPLVESWLASGDAYGVLIQSTGEDGVDFTSSEADENRPYFLIITE